LKPNAIPRNAVYRLSLYRHCLQQFHEGGIQTISSSALAEAAGVKPTQLRKDLNYFGQFGTRGRGYNVEELLRAASEVLGTNRLQPVVLVGVGNLGSALMAYQGFARAGFQILAGFDLEWRQRQKHKQFTQPVLSPERLGGFCRKHRVKLAILSVPASAAQEAAEQLVKAGVRAILNFTPTVLRLPKSVTVNNVNLASELENLSYFGR
jgi:redox-sensing transcriptional repressor